MKRKSLMNNLKKEYLYTDCTEKEYKDWYIYNCDNFTDDLKYIIINDLTEQERRIILLYAHLGNMRAVSAQLDVSLGKISKVVNQIRYKIKHKLNDYKDN